MHFKTSSCTFLAAIVVPEASRAGYPVENNTAGRTGRTALVDSFRRLCLEHRALQLLLKEVSGTWPSDVRRVSQSPGPLRDADTRFGAVFGSLQSPLSEDAFLLELDKVVRQYMVLAELPK
jgi:hypothetical protein